MSPKDLVSEQKMTQQYCLKWNNHQVNLLRSFDRLLKSEAFTDVTLSCDGKSLKAHKVVLSACSTYFEALFEEHPNSMPIIILKDMEFIHISQLVNFMYLGEINITQDMLAGLLKTAETLKVKGLAEVSGDRNSAVNNVTSALQNNISNNVSHQALNQPLNFLSNSAFRVNANNSGVPPPLIQSSSALTAALNSPVSAPSLAPFAALLNPENRVNQQSLPYKRRINHTDEKEHNNNNNNNNNNNTSEKSPKLLKKDEIKTEKTGGARTPSPPANQNTPKTNSSCNNSGSKISISSSIFSNIANISKDNLTSPLMLPPPLLTASNNQLSQLQNSLHHHHLSQHLPLLQSKLHSIFPSSLPTSLISSASSPQSKLARSRSYDLPSPTSPIQQPLTPLPPELALTTEQGLPDFLKGSPIYKLNDYLGFRTRQQFWEEPGIRKLMDAIKNKEIDMKSAAEIVGVSYGTLYGRYREVYGYLKHAWVNKSGGKSSTAGRDKILWEESRSQELIRKVLAKELSLTAAAVQLGVDYNTLFAHITNNGKNQDRVALLTGGQPLAKMRKSKKVKGENGEEGGEDNIEAELDGEEMEELEGVNEYEDDDEMMEYNPELAASYAINGEDEDGIKDGEEGEEKEERENEVVESQEIEEGDEVEDGEMEDELNEEELEEEVDVDGEEEVDIDVEQELEEEVDIEDVEEEADIDVEKDDCPKLPLNSSVTVQTLKKNDS